MCRSRLTPSLFSRTDSNEGSGRRFSLLDTAIRSRVYTTKIFNNIYTSYPSHLSKVLSKALSPDQESLGPVERVGEISPHRSGKPSGTQTENKPRPHVSTEKSRTIADKGKVWSLINSTISFCHSAEAFT